MKKEDALAYYKKEVDDIKEAGLFKGEKLITSPQGAKVKLEDGRELLNMCANNYLGLANDSRVMAAAAKSYEERGYGLSSVRFICGRRMCIKSWRLPSAAFSVRRIQFCIHLVLMLTAGCLRPF